MVVFPRMMAPFVVGRASSIAALEEALGASEKRIFLAAQKDPKVDEPQAGDIHEMGVVAIVVQSLKLPNGHIKVMVEGVSRGLIRSVAPAAGHLAVAVETVEPRAAAGPEVTPYLQKVLGVFEQYAKLSHHLAFEALVSSLKMDDADAFADVLAGHLPTSIPTADKQSLLETVSPLERMQKLQDLLEIEIEKINIDRRINSKVKKQMERAQKEYYLNEKIKAIQQEMGKKDDKSDEIEELRAKIEKAGMPKETKEKALAELEAPRGDAERLGRGHRLSQLHRLARLRAVEEGLTRDAGPEAGRHRDGSTLVRRSPGCHSRLRRERGASNSRGRAAHERAVGQVGRIAGDLGFN